MSAPDFIKHTAVHLLQVNAHSVVLACTLDCTLTKCAVHFLGGR